MDKGSARRASWDGRCGPAIAPQGTEAAPAVKVPTKARNLQMTAGNGSVRSCPEKARTFQISACLPT